ncbi:MAG: rRNA pseudouridine synthase [Candidatus Nanopelagicaceae bacterium]|jgi:23S rRNA pseudouridine2605 synthase|nr:rRNA pseudouridine synthase [Candidatus Nanopelagicaceae bacterium]
MAELVRLQKFMADCGVASRRACEALIDEGRVKVNGKIVKAQGVKIDPINTKVEVDNELISATKTKTYLAFNKPAGILSTMSDPEGRPSLQDFFGSWPDRLFHVGRLDKESEGLIILTNDGQWAHESTHPSFGVEKTYLVQTEEPISRSAFQNLVEGVELDDGLAKPISVARRGAMIEVVIHEGRNQIVRRMFDALGYPVERLIRTAIGSIKLGELPPGKWRSLNSVELVNR